MCKKVRSFLAIPVIAALMFAGAPDVFAQFKSDIPSVMDRTGTITKETRPLNDERILGLFEFQMDHSYEMSLSSIGGDMYNQNFYTNTMHFLFNEDLYGRLDLGVAHSPFGNSLMGNDQSAQFMVRNAEINYRLNENTHFRFSFQQQPARYGYGYGGYGYGPAYYSGFGHHGFHRSRYHPFAGGW